MNALHNRPFLPFSHCLVTHRATNMLHSRFAHSDEWRHHPATTATRLAGGTRGSQGSGDRCLGGHWIQRRYVHNSESELVGLHF